MLFALDTMHDAYFATGAVVGLGWLSMRLWAWWTLRPKNANM